MNHKSVPYMPIIGMTGSGKTAITLKHWYISGIGSLSLCIPYKLGRLGDSNLFGMVRRVEVSSNAFALILGIATYNLANFIERCNIKEKEEE